jgi:protein-S-isoprenylcysteine O-methyltransferase Ste14
MKAASIVGLAIMVAGIVGLYYAHSLFSPSPVVIAVQAAAVALMIWARLTFGKRSFHAAANPTEGGLVTTGPYHFIRHPIYTAACLFCWAGALANLTVVSAAAGLLVLIGAWVRLLVEERLVVARYPEYREYAKATRRMVPYLF